MSIKAFVDNKDFSNNTFCERFLSSSEFTLETLKEILYKIGGLRKNSKNKQEIASYISSALEKELINGDEILKAYVEQPRQWLSVRLVEKLAKSANEILKLSEDSEKLQHIENALLRTLIKEWGTKSYGFSLDKISDSSENSSQSSENKPKCDRVFKAHCYFGLKPNSKTQDSLLHLKCYNDYGASVGTLKFLLRELAMGLAMETRT